MTNDKHPIKSAVDLVENIGDFVDENEEDIRTLEQEMKGALGTLFGEAVEADEDVATSYEYDDDIEVSLDVGLDVVESDLELYMRDDTKPKKIMVSVGGENIMVKAPSDSDLGGVEWELNNGILTVTIPREE